MDRRGCGALLSGASASGIETSIAWGGIYNNPFHRNKMDQVGLGFFWDKTTAVAMSRATAMTALINKLTVNGNTGGAGFRFARVVGGASKLQSGSADAFNRSSQDVDAAFPTRA